MEGWVYILLVAPLDCYLKVPFPKQKKSYVLLPRNKSCYIISTPPSGDCDEQ